MGNTKREKQTQVKSKKNPTGASFDAWLDQQMENPSFADEYIALEPEFQLIKQLIALRLKRGLTQRQLALKMGTPQPSIARMESHKSIKNLDFVRRMAAALDARVEVRIVPNHKKTTIPQS